MIGQVDLPVVYCLVGTGRSARAGATALAQARRPVNEISPVDILATELAEKVKQSVVSVRSSVCFYCIF